LTFFILGFLAVVPVGNCQTPESKSATNTTNIATNKLRLAPFDGDILRKNLFKEKEIGIFRRDRMPIGELKRLLHFEDDDMTCGPSSGPVPRFLVIFPNGRCLLTISEKETFWADFRKDTTLVDIYINTNALLPSLIEPAQKSSKRVRNPQEKP
jgi:hypothetical protein